MKTITPDNRSNDPQRRHLETQLQELTKQYEQLTARIAALDTDIGREVDSERRMVLKQRRQEQSDEREQIGAQIVEIERQLAGAITAAPSKPTVSGHPSTGSDKTAAPVSRSVLHRYRGFLAAGAGVFVVAILIMLLNSLFQPTADVPTTTSVPAPIIRETEPVVAIDEATRTSMPAGPTPGTPIAETTVFEPTVAKSDPVTATPSLTLATKGDVIITELDASKATRRYEFARRLEDDLKRRLDEYGLTNVTVTVSPQVVGSSEEAKSLAEEAGGAAVIWGWYDDLDVGIRVELLDEAKVNNLASTTQLPLLSAGEQSTELAVVVREVLPQNVSFLSLFVVGHLNYLANNYEAGHRAFDAAMDAMPAEARLENESLLHFFNARKLENSDAPEDFIAVVCGYADAIDADPAFAPSYNNLASVISRRFISTSARAEQPLPTPVIDCLQRIGFYDEDYVEKIPLTLYDQALMVQPGLVVAEYNRASYTWTQSQPWGCSYGDDCLIDVQSLAATIESILERDDSVVGARIILGNLAFESGEYEVARFHFEQASQRNPRDARLLFNLSQTLRKLGDPRAVELLDRAIALDKTTYEAALMMTILESRQGDRLRAMSLVDKIPEETTPEPYLTTPQAMAQFLRAFFSYDNGDIEAAIMRLSDLVELAPDEFLLHYLLNLLHQITGDSAASALHMDRVQETSISLHESHLYVESYYRVQNSSLALTWYRVVEECSGDVTSNDCLPQDVDERVRTLFNLAFDSFDERLYYNRGALDGRDYFILGQACPYVYVINPDTGEWQMETTILHELVGLAREQLQFRSLRNFDGRLLIREEEPEISYINRLYVIVHGLNGEVVQLETTGPNAEALLSSDTSYLVLNPGDMVELHFPGYDPEWHVGPIYVVAQGYYDPLQ